MRSDDNALPEGIPPSSPDSDGMQPVNIVKDGNRFNVVFDGGSRRFIKRADLDEWKAKVDAYWASLPSSPPNAPPNSPSPTSPVRPAPARPSRKDVPMPVSERPSTRTAQKNGTLTVSSGSTSTSVRLKGRVELDYSPRDLGFILRGFVERARGCGPDPHSMFLPAESCEPESSPHEEKLLEMGSELFDALPATASFFDINSEEWAGWFRRGSPERCTSTSSTREPLAHSGPHPSASPPSPPSPSTTEPVGPPAPNAFSPTYQNSAWMAPVNGHITARFGQKREGGDVHEGIDIGVPVGTPVVAPQTMQVTKVGFSERAGRFVVANVMRSDGQFDDGDGYRLTFANLSEVHVEEDAVVQRGQSFARSGATGNVTGPHLHFRTQWVEDGVLSDDVISIDPLAVIPEAVFVGQMPPVDLGVRQAMGIRGGQPINIVIAPGAGRVSAGAKGLVQPDVGLQLPLLSEDVAWRPTGPGGIDQIDPLEGIVTAAFREAPGVIRGVGNFAQGVGQLASIGGTLAGFIPGAAPVAVPVATVGAAVGAAARPVSQVSAGVVELGARFFDDIA